ncbi:MAG: hypothetical protein FD161_3424 [Limisphaerales bacterium]|nr:MAG: hypothetical protein FD161_3424 [Limisphaerales bacterium]KAG0507745.1 MAG: hypothetical protein E1N63_3090 [Limisphaerales bacterium]TXT51090.1 MAG: hypothetical protein FD140_1936 [Limisphaerales bacterium]
MKRNRVISFLKTPIFKAKEYLHRRPQPGFRCDFAPPEQKEPARKALAELEREGIALLPAHFTGARLEKLRQAFEEAVRNHPDKANPDSLINEDILHLSPAFVEAALDDVLLETIGGYYGKPFAVGRANAMRILPSPETRYGSYQWHHDSRGRQVHVMILLQDMPENGQKMSYLRQSHLRYYDHWRGLAEGSRFEKEVHGNPELAPLITHITGPAGTVGIFDANGLHSGNRCQTVTRDTLTYCYVTYRHFKKIRCRKADVAALPPAKRGVLTFNPFCEQLD